MAGFTDVLRPEKVSGAHFKRWQVKATLWLEAMKVFWITVGSSEGNISEEDQRKFQEDNTIFRGQRHGLQSITLTPCFYKNIYQKVIYVYFYESIFQDKSIYMAFTFPNSTT